MGVENNIKMIEKSYFELVGRRGGVSFSKDTKGVRKVKDIDGKGIYEDNEGNKYKNSFRVTRSFTEKFLGKDGRIDPYENGVLVKVCDTLVYCTQEEADKYGLQDITVHLAVEDGITSWS